MGLKYRRKRSRKRYTGEKIPMVVPQGINQCWSMDFVSDSLADGRKFRVFNLIDNYSREAIVQHVDLSISGLRLVRIFEEIKRQRFLPRQLVCDNGTEFTSYVFRKWASKNNVEICYIDKGKPTQNAFVESFDSVKYLSRFPRSDFLIKQFQYLSLSIDSYSGTFSCSILKMQHAASGQRSASMQIPHLEMHRQPSSAF